MGLFITQSSDSDDWEFEPLRAGQQKAALMCGFLIGMAYVQIRKKPASEKHKSDAGFFIKF